MAIASLLALFGLFGAGWPGAVSGSMGPIANTLVESTAAVEPGEAVPHHKASPSSSLWRRTLGAVWLVVLPLLVALLVRPVSRRGVRRVDDVGPRGRAPAAARPTRAPPASAIV